MGVSTTPAPKGLGPQNPTKKLAHVGVLLGHLLSQNRVPKLSDPGPPLRKPGCLRPGDGKKTSICCFY